MLLQKTKSPRFNYLSSIKLSELPLFGTQPKSSLTILSLKLLTPQLPRSRPSNFWLDSVTLTKLVQSATKSGCLIRGKLVLAYMIKTSFKPCLFLMNTLLNMFCKCRDTYTADQLFGKMAKYNIVTYNSLISGYTHMGIFGKALMLFNEARMIGLKLDKFTYASALTVVSQTGNLNFGKLIHGLIFTSGLGNQVILTNSLIDMYSKCGRVDHARILFEHSVNLDDVSWNSLIAGYAQNGAYEDMLRFLGKMHQSGLSFNTYTLGSVLKACCTNFDASEKCGEMLHSFAIKRGLDLDFVVGTALLDMYAKTGNLANATQIFELIPNQNVVMYNTMISGLLHGKTIENKCACEALNLFAKMQRQGIRPSNFTFSSILKACNAVEAFKLGKQIHAQICKNGLDTDEYIGSALIDVYSLLGLMKDALLCFNLIPNEDIVSLTAIIVGYLQNGLFESALAWFYDLLGSGRKPDEFIISSILSACANLATARSGEQIQGYVRKTGFGEFTIIQNSQICMYAKSGDIHSASLTFEETGYPDLVSWSTIICSNAQHGRAKEALRLFELMKDCGIEPNHITFLGVLTACSHGGLVEEGLQHFESMRRTYGIVSHVKHCACVVDLLGRDGRLADAEKFILQSGFEHEPVMWRALLSACRIYKDTITGTRVGERVIELEPQASASYVLLYNIYTDAGMQLAASKIRELMKDLRIKKEPGLSWIEIGNKVHSFVVGDRSHKMVELIYTKLEELLEKIKNISCADEVLVSSSSMGQHKDSTIVNYHSEKLAVTFGILSLPKLAPVRVMKNLRVCQDCHTTIKLFSMVEKREIILRDPIRFHHFKEGSCSCRDYW